MKRLNENMLIKYIGVIDYNFISKSKWVLLIYDIFYVMSCLLLIKIIYLFNMYI